MLNLNEKSRARDQGRDRNILSGHRQDDNVAV